MSSAREFPFVIFDAGTPTSRGYKPLQGSTYYDTGSAFQMYIGDGTAWQSVAATAVAGGAVAGPGVSVVGNIPLWNNVIGSLLSDSGKSFSTDGTFAANSDNLIPTQRAAKTYTDAVAQGLDVRASCLLATAAALAANTYANGAAGVGATLTANANGALSIDGVAVNAADRVLIKNEAAPANNGIYTVTAAGSGGTPYILTRATDYDQAADILAGTFTFVESGTVNAGGGFVMTTTGAIVVGTTAIVWTQFSGAGEITVTTPLTKAGNSLGVVNQGTSTQVLHGNAAGNAGFSAVVPGDLSFTPGMIFLATATPTGTGVVTFNPIASLIPAGVTIKHLYILAKGRSDAAITLGNINVTFNNDTGANYDFGMAEVFGAAVGINNAVAQTSMQGGAVTGASATAGRAGYGAVTVYDYADTNLQKVCKVSRGGMNSTTSASILADEGYGGWRSTAPITRVDLTLSSGNWVAGSIVSLYGLTG